MASALPSRASHSSDWLDSPYLFETTNGAVLHCDCCDRFQVMFDDVLLLLTQREFSQLLHTVAATAETVRDAAPRWWRLSTPTGAGEVTVPVKSSELLELADLLQGAAVMRELDDMLKTATTR